MTMCINFGHDSIYYSLSATIKFLCSGYSEAAEVLINAGADVNAKGYNGNTPLILTANAGHTHIAKLLLKHPDIKIHEVVCLCNIHVHVYIGV